jgi:hypothetical protein
MTIFNSVAAKVLPQRSGADDNGSATNSPDIVTAVVISMERVVLGTV